MFTMTKLRVFLAFLTIGLIVLIFAKDKGGTELEAQFPGGQRANEISGGLKKNELDTTDLGCLFDRFTEASLLLPFSSTQSTRNFPGYAELYAQGSAAVEYASARIERNQAVIAGCFVRNGILQQLEPSDGLKVIPPMFVNHLRNCSFEDLDGLSGWQLFDKSLVTHATIDGSASIHGRRCLRILLHKRSEQLGISQLVSIPAGRSCSFSFFFINQGPGDLQVATRLTFRQAARTTLQREELAHVRVDREQSPGRWNVVGVDGVGPHGSDSVEVSILVNLDKSAQSSNLLVDFAALTVSPY